MYVVLIPQICGNLLQQQQETDHNFLLFLLTYYCIKCIKMKYVHIITN